MSFLSGIWARILTVSAAIASLVAIIFFANNERKKSARSKMTYELAKVREEISIENKLVIISDEEKTLLTLKEKESVILDIIEEIKVIEYMYEKEVSVEELDSFFKKHGL